MPHQRRVRDDALYKSTLNKETEKRNSSAAHIYNGSIDLISFVFSGLASCRRLTWCWRESRRVYYWRKQLFIVVVITKYRRPGSRQQRRHVSILTPTVYTLYIYRVGQTVSTIFLLLWYLQDWDCSLQSCFTRVADMTSRRRLQYSAPRCLVVPLVWLSTVGQRASVPSCRSQHVERPSAPHHISTFTRGLLTASPDFPFLIPTRTS